MAIKSFKRYEKKFILDKEQYNKLIPKLLEYMTPDKYFDTLPIAKARGFLVANTLIYT